MNKPETQPSEVDEKVGFFDRFAERCSLFVSQAPFFAGCVIFVALWLTQGIVKIGTTGSFKSFANTTYQLEINTTTTIITFLMVAILQNAQTRSTAALQKKLNAVADALADLLDWTAENARSKRATDDLKADAEELRMAVGLEHREST